MARYALRRYALRKDAVHKQIVEGLRANGIVVIEMPQPGDVLCYDACWRKWMPMEFKSPRATRGESVGGKHGLTKAQQKTQQSAPIPVVSDLASALKLFGF